VKAEKAQGAGHWAQVSYVQDSKPFSPIPLPQNNYFLFMHNLE
jgi:hypothetical protein